MSLLLWVLLLGGITIGVGDRAPTILYLDLFLPVWLAYQIFWRGVLPDFGDRKTTYLAIVCFMAFLASALFNPLDVFKSLAAIKVYCVGFLFYGLARRKPPALLTLSLWGAAVGALLLYDYFHSWADLISTRSIVAVKDEVAITIGRSNYVASILLLLMPLSIAAFTVELGKRRWLSVGCCVVMILGLASTLSRGALAAGVVGLVVCLPLIFRAGLKFKHVLAGAAALILVYFILPSDILSANAQLYELKFANSDLRRIDLMRETWSDFEDNPMLGVGPGQLATWIKLHGVEDVLSGMNAHNLVLNALGEMGILGGVPVLLIVGLLLVRVWRDAWNLRTPLAVALCVSFTTVILHNMVEASFEGEEFQIVFWTVAALIPCANARSKSHAETQNRRQVPGNPGMIPSTA